MALCFKRHHRLLDLGDKPLERERLRQKLVVGAPRGPLRVIPSYPAARDALGMIAVGTLIAERPPLRSVRAQFERTAHTSGVDGQARN